jgi:hypothetical protein
MAASRGHEEEEEGLSRGVRDMPEKGSNWRIILGEGGEENNETVT